MKSVLFIPIGFYNYDIKIEKEIQRLGYEVTTFTPIGHYSVVEKLINGVTGGRYLKRKSTKRQEKYLLQSEKQYDYVFVIVGRHLDVATLQAMKTQQKNARFILYLWDDIDRVEGYEEKKQYYDDIYSFDLRDVEKYGVRHLPLFYTDVHEYQGESKNIIFNLSGLLHSDRLRIWDALKGQCKLDKEQCFLYLLGAKMGHFFKAILPGQGEWMSLRYIHINGMPFEKMADVMKHSKVALDVQFGSQAGLTMRTLESLGTHTKLVTTNPYVKKYDFYKYGNICVIDRDHPEVPVSFFETEYQEIPLDIQNKYKLSNWVKTMLCEEDIDV